MDRVEALAAAGRSSVSIYHKFRLQYWNDRHDLICCFEGNEDLTFYLPFIRQAVSNQNVRVSPVMCSGKHNLFEIIDQSKKDGVSFDRAWFFCDKDFDEFLGWEVPHCKSLFVTCFYSIESYLVDADTFNGVWTDYFHLDFSDPRYATWAKRRELFLRNAALLLLPIMATAVAMKRQGLDVNFDNVNLMKAIRVDSSGEITKRVPRWREALSGTFLNNLNHKPMLGVRQAKADIESSDFRNWCRGKFLLTLFAKFLEQMKQELGQRGATPKRAVVKVGFGEGTAVETLSSRAQIPPALEEFLSIRSATFRESLARATSAAP